ncbi:MAG: polyprenyl synthetase family protein [Rikenellaceae bacterium]
MTNIEQIQKIIEAPLEQYNSLVKQALKSQDPYLNQICEYVLSNKGKGLRPMLSILTAALHGTPDSKVYDAAFLLEIAHTTSLIHDDVVDESYMRRGQPSLNALWNGRTAVLVGDYLLTRALCHCLDNNISEQVSMVCRALYHASEGELAQSRKVETLNMDRDSYFDIIYKKTAVLFGASAAIGAHSIGADAKAIADMQALGDNIGIAFQIKDDILDYTCDEATTGKPSCCDLREKKITLPLLYTLEQASAEHKALMLDKLSSIDSHPENIEYLRGEVFKAKGIEYAQKIKEEYCDKAAAMLSSYEQSQIKTAILLFIDTVRA